MRIVLPIISLIMMCCVNLSAQLLLPGKWELNKDSTIVMDGYVYQCDELEGAAWITLYNKENKWTYADQVYKATGESYAFTFSSKVETVVEDDNMLSKAYSIVDNAFDYRTAKTFGSDERFLIAMFLSTETGKVDEVRFEFLLHDIYSHVPISVYRDIELKLKE